MEASSNDIYEAVVALSRFIAGRNDLESLLSGVGESLRRIVGFEYLGLTLYDREHDRMRSQFLSDAGAPARYDVLQHPGGAGQGRIAVPSR